MTRFKCTLPEASGSRVRRMTTLVRALGALSSVLALALPAAAQADDPTALGKIPCVAQSDGTRFCQGSVSTRVPSFDGQPIDANVALPKTTGPAPPVLILTGYGGSKNPYDARSATVL